MTSGRKKRVTYALGPIKSNLFITYGTIVRKCHIINVGNFSPDLKHSEDEDMGEMYGGGIKGDILNDCYKCKTSGDLVNYRKYKWNNNEDNDGEEDIE